MSTSPQEGRPSVQELCFLLQRCNVVFPDGKTQQPSQEHGRVINTSSWGTFTDMVAVLCAYHPDCQAATVSFRPQMGLNLSIATRVSPASTKLQEYMERFMLLLGEALRPGDEGLTGAGILVTYILVDGLGLDSSASPAAFLGVVDDRLSHKTAQNLQGHPSRWAEVLRGWRVAFGHLQALRGRNTSLRLEQAEVDHAMRLWNWATTAVRALRGSSELSKLRKEDHDGSRLAPIARVFDSLRYITSWIENVRQGPEPRSRALENSLKNIRIVWIESHPRPVEEQTNPILLRKWLLSVVHSEFLLPGEPESVVDRLLGDATIPAGWTDFCNKATPHQDLALLAHLLLQEDQKNSPHYIASTSPDCVVCRACFDEAEKQQMTTLFQGPLVTDLSPGLPPTVTPLVENILSEWLSEAVRKRVGSTIFSMQGESDTIAEPRLLEELTRWRGTLEETRNTGSL
ncbi:hypothetical protein BD311DRAFT_798263 [Dichomitus squalens]|uniref:Uncharacterized protein n=1 Tax=Dichomitus squalens TaxID=114155 RepID=A0A4Q9MGN5_9APHY|nr:hypothetical protein BD311DRAFT_798263 [Dichomitus squalens]